MPQKLIGGRYRLAEEIASGGLGRVWRARDETLGVEFRQDSVKAKSEIAKARELTGLRAASPR